MPGKYAYLLMPLLLLLAGCPTTPPAQPAPDSDVSESADTTTSPAETEIIGAGEETDAESSDRELRDQNIIYFDFDASTVRREFNDVLVAHARYLAENTAVRVRLEGHADERGSREYNIGLGESRSQSVRRVFLIQGVSASQIITVSFGEERPAVHGRNEDAWAKNRRVEIVYR